MDEKGRITRYRRGGTDNRHEDLLPDEKGRAL